MNRAQQAQDAAAAWIIRRENGNWSERDQAAFDTWLADSDGNKVAYWRLKHSWDQADRIGSLGVGTDETEHHAGLLRYWKPAAIAALLALMVGIGTVQYQGRHFVPALATTRYDTPVGGQRSIPLADGSRIELNTRSVVRTAVSKTQRRVWLDNGEAFFQVAHDAAHPFVIFAGPKRITVLGTRFSVRRDGDEVSVSVLEGRVRIDDADAPAGNSISSATITGGVLAVSQGPSTLVTQKSEERVEDELAWRDGMLKFDQTPLSEVATEFNRYNRRHIVIADPAAAAIRIGGTFQATNMEAFTRLLRDAYGLRIAVDSDDIKISS